MEAAWAVEAGVADEAVDVEIAKLGTDKVSGGPEGADVVTDGGAPPEAPGAETDDSEETGFEPPMA